MNRRRLSMIASAVALFAFSMMVAHIGRAAHEVGRVLGRLTSVVVVRACPDAFDVRACGPVGLVGGAAAFAPAFGALALIGLEAAGNP